ncbi:MAG: hypothetical protein Q7O12_01145, partial [Deltaproteobacteria bacterium]|nr:hypothetical protein [Deltaproteobacteria bacterium]
NMTIALNNQPDILCAMKTGHLFVLLTLLKIRTCQKDLLVGGCHYGDFSVNGGLIMKLGRTKYWWFWPNFYDAEDAHDGAKMGVVACAIIAGVTGLTSTYSYYMDSNIYGLLGGMIIVLIYAPLGYGIFKMSRVASSVALILFLGEKSYTFYVQGKSQGIALLLIWYLVQANRAIYWFNREQKKNRGDI